MVNQGETFERRIEYKDSNNTPIDLTGFHSKLQIRPSAGSNIIYATLSSSISPDGTGLNMTPYSASTMLPESSGSIGITISSYSSSLFTFSEAFYDLFIYSGSGASMYSDKVMEGKVKLVKSITVI
jgi:hypothetical protein